MTELPRDLPILERDVVRLVVHDTLDQILLLHTHEPTVPELGQWWELPGGGIDPGETYRQAAIRELWEETGITVSDYQIGAPTWTRDGTFRHRNLRHLQHEVVVEVQLTGPGPDVDESNRLDYELEDYFGFRWWPIPQVLASTDQFYPRRLSRLLTRFLDGDTITEPLEVWT
ncbi:MAG TPA: NUDIX domain-containing protein [Dermatophilaceae bacterium]|nr:NUDIX domain-containing protein [Dermatophilaceae bacterium]